MHVGSIIASATIGTSTNIDIIGIGKAYGAKGNRLPLSFCLVAAILSMSACLVGSLSGIRIEHMLSTDICNLIGSGVLIAVGIWTIIQDLYNRHRPRLQVETQLGFHEWMLVGLAQTLTDLSVGVGLGFSSINIWLTVVLLGLFSFLFLFIPSKFFPKRTHGLGNHAAIFSGALLIIVGCIL